MANKTKCPGCSLYFDRDTTPFVHLKNRYWHNLCHESANQQLNQDEQDYKILEEYVIKLFKVEYLDARIKKQLKDMMATYGFSYSGIHKTLVYWYEVKGSSIAKANGGLGIVPYVYEPAKKYFYTQYMAQLQNKDKNAAEFVTEGRTIIITSPKRKGKQMKIIDFDAFEEVEHGK